MFFHDGKYLVIDGGHRFLAAQKIGKKTLQCVPFGGTKEEAVKVAIAANSTHGLPRTNDDKRHAVTIALKTFPTLKNRQLAKLCCVTHPFVGTVRKELETVSTSGDETGDKSASKRAGSTKKNRSKEGDGEGKEKKFESSEDRSEATRDDADTDSDAKTPTSQPSESKNIDEVLTECEKFLLQQVEAVAPNEQTIVWEKLRHFVDTKCT